MEWFPTCFIVCRKCLVTGLAAYSVIYQSSSKGVILWENGVVNGVLDGREMCFGKNDLCFRFMPSGVMILEKSDCESLHDRI